MSETETTNPVATVYYRGRVLLNNGKMGESFERMTGETLIFTPKKRLALSIGHAYEIEEPKEGTFVLASARRSPLVSPHRLTAEWRTKALRDEAEFEAAKVQARIAKVAKEENKDIGEMTLNDLRELFALALPDQKAALMTVVMRYLRPY